MRVGLLALVEVGFTAAVRMAWAVLAAEAEETTVALVVVATTDP